MIVNWAVPLGRTFMDFGNTSGCEDGGPTVRVEVTCDPTASVTVYITEVPSGTLSGTVTLNVPPLWLTVEGAGGSIEVGLAETV